MANTGKIAAITYVWNPHYPLASIRNALQIQLYQHTDNSPDGGNW